MRQMLRRLIHYYVGMPFRGARPSRWPGAAAVLVNTVTNRLKEASLHFLMPLKNEKHWG